MVVGFVGLDLAFGAIFMVLLLVVIFAAGIGGVFLGLHFRAESMWLVLAGIGGVLAVAVPLSWISGVVNPVYRCALYIYATEGVVPGTFDQELLDSAWKVK
jgi:hypothetical protein